MSDDDTRDIAVIAKAMIEGHMTDCTKFRVAIADTLKEFRDDLKRLNWRMAMLLGGLIILSHGVDWILTLTGRK